MRTLSFTVAAATPVSIGFYTADAPWADAVMADIRLNRTDASGVHEVEAGVSGDNGDAGVRPIERYDLGGRPVKGSSRGLIIEKRTGKDGKIKTIKRL